jgi:hypothetical protein
MIRESAGSGYFIFSFDHEDALEAHIADWPSEDAPGWISSCDSALENCNVWTSRMSQLRRVRFRSALRRRFLRLVRSQISRRTIIPRLQATSNVSPILRLNQMGESRQYTTQLGAGLGMIQETFDLLRLWEPGDTQRVTSTEDPLQTVTHAGGRAQIRSDRKALVSIKDYLGETGQVEGRRLLEHFNEPPFGWSKDTTRYLLAALFVVMDVKFRIAGQEHLVKNDETFGALSSNKALGSVGIALREEQPDPDALARASDRLRDLTGENILPLEDEVASAAKKHFLGFQQNYSALATELRNLKVAGADRADDLSADLIEVVRGDGSDAVLRLGGVDSPLYDSLEWAPKVKQAFANGLHKTIADLQQVCSEILQLPDSGIPGRLKSASTDHVSQVSGILSKETFYDESAGLQTAKHELAKHVETAVADLAQQQTHLRATELAKWQDLPDWADLLAEDRAWFATEVDKLAMNGSSNIAGLRRLLALEFNLNPSASRVGKGGQCPCRAKAQRA